MTAPAPRKPYDTDLTDVQRLLLAPLLPPRKFGGFNGGRPGVCQFEAVNAILYMARCGCAWRHLPHDFPHWRTVYGYFRQWANDGTLVRIHDALRDKVREQSGRAAQPHLAIVDSQSVKTVEKGGSSGVLTRARRSPASNATSLSTRSA